ncbi:hypothetical protein GCM10022243_20070 [Saccharothrix violaceirubra]|uniref:Uncharacterized protein n=1 Tax=Saccharothrix violaceirubra TaxID=413306 RepID=A0A7W7WV94_9PSEU|nr:hypothetical protein [Saccharothrix violaceirubra]MBB4965089.1 hypothetical protein [Saccharothrix violaceirubra]
MTIADLVDRVSPILPDPVDELQVAAVLESQGVTDQAAADDYGEADVFALARRVFPLLPGREDDPPAPPADRRTRIDLLHGPLYLLPTLAYPAAFEVLGSAVAVRALVFATAFGWVWGAGASFVAYQLVGLDARGSATRTFLHLGWLGLGVGTLLSLPLLLFGGGLGVPLFVLAQLAVQQIVGVLLFHRRERVLAYAMLPAGIGGLGYLALSDERFAWPVLALGCVSVVLGMESARRSGRAHRDADGVRLPEPRVLVKNSLPGLAYATMCAALVLYVDARYVLGALDLAVAAAPLVLGMGVVELRANRLFEHADGLLREPLRPGEFHERMWRALLRELATCLVALGALALVLLAVLRSLGVLTSAGAFLVDGHVVLGGVFFLGFVLVRTGGAVLAPALLGGASLGCVTTAELVADPLTTDSLPRVFLATGIALSVLLLTALRRGVGQVRHYR